MAEDDEFTAARLAALSSYSIMDTESEQGFDDIVLLASHICQTPVSLVSLVEKDRQWFKARIGFPPCETPLGQSVCAHALREDDMLIIPDLTQDSRTHDNTLVTEDPNIRFYAGAVLKSADGVPLGTLCVIDTVPRPQGLSWVQIDSLKALARQVENQMELRRIVKQRDEALVRAKAADEELQTHQTLLRNELNHRLKNILSIVQSIAAQSFRGAGTLEAARTLIESRVAALGRAQDILVASSVESATLGDIVRDATAPHDPDRRISGQGDDVRLGAKTALLFALTLHELATNATKYGALSTPGGRVDLTWMTNQGELVIEWREIGGPPVNTPSRRGFGTHLIEGALAAQVGGRAMLDYKPGGMEYRLVAPIGSLT
ncbi:two-component sensor histidine kinase [Devosia sp. UYZn731]|uniref:HWE histidine kinase domain-containing protein n=1 Tax=Devosia sp. UYZn731 TaxID=3156345 RepID=UPI003394E85E